MPGTGRATNDPKTNQRRIRLSDGEVAMLNYCREVYGTD
jgi:hypothetical protein